jgi:predicted site-specific integrase-resolvase
MTRCREHDQIMMIDDNLISLGDAARRLRIAPSNVAYYVKRGRIRFIETPLGRLYAREDVECLARQIAARRRKRRLDREERA